MDRRVRKLALAVLPVAVAIAGCGGGGSNVAQPKPKQPIGAAMAAFNKAIADQSCDEVERITFSQLRRTTIPGAPAQPQECAPATRALHNLKGTKFTKAQQYGTGALIEGPPTKKRPPNVPKGTVVVPQAIFVLDRDRKYRFIIAAVDKTQIGVKPTGGAVDHGRNARAVIAAVRAKDCKKLVPLLHPASYQALGAPSTAQKECASFAHSKIFGPAIRATKDAKPVLMGQTRDIAFYGISTKKGYFTMIMLTPPGTSVKAPLFFGVFLNTNNPALPKTQK